MARKHGLPVAQVVGRGRTSEIVSARREWIAVTVDTLALTESEASRLFGLDRSSIRHAHRQYHQQKGNP